MIKKQYGIPALVIGLMVLGGSTAYAFGPGGFDAAAFSSFTASEQAALEKAYAIREAAETEAKAVLDAAGITQEELHDAMRAYGEKQHAKLAEALENNDYDAFVALTAGGPNADKLTKEVFATLVEIHTLEEAGDHEGAMELRKDLKDSGFVGHGGFGGHGPMGPRSDRADK
jgi:hypothetical protein